MKRKIVNLYNIDINYEKRTYKNVGLDYAPQGIYKIISWIRKRRNGNEKRYEVCNTYSEWEEHVKNKLPLEIINYRDFVHWMIDQKRIAESYLEMAKVILIPIYITLLSMGNFVSEKRDSDVNFGFIIIFAIMIIIISVVIIGKEKNNVDFWDDYLKIATRNNE